MKKRRKIKLKYKKDRVLLSDVLPYELPIIMSNRMLYRFCVKNKIRYNVKDCMLEWDRDIDSPSFEVLKLLFHSSFQDTSNLPSPCDGQAKLNSYSTVPFVFHILHKESEYRALSVVHPAMQIGMVSFYDEFKPLIIHYCNRSRYSIRHPHAVASFFYYKDKLHHKLLGTKKDKIELFFNEYENLKTFFSYKKYTQIFRFYDDYRYQRAEKRFKHLLRFDIQKCFDSIYTHTIAWATQGGKDAYKLSFKGKDTSSFGGVFDTLMQRLNYNETNGIVIGPEFSRIFAEIILQHIDRTVEYKLKAKGYCYGIDYQLYRYVDDYFLFYNDDNVKSIAIELFQLALEEYKLKISREKTVEYQRPFITDISRAKIRIDSLIDQWLKYKSNESHVPEVADAEEKDIAECEYEDDIFVPDKKRIQGILDETGYFPLISRKFNQQYKDILITIGVKPKDVLNYTLSCIFTRINRELKCFDQKYKYLKLTTLSKLPEFETERELCSIRLIKMERQLSHFLIDAIDSAFFLFSLNCRLNSTLKLTRILNVIIIYLKGFYRVKDKIICSRFKKEFRDEIFGQIHLEVINVLSRFKCLEYAQLEILYLLIIMKSIDSTHPISAKLLKEHLCLDITENNTFHLNIIAINVIIYYIGNKKQYNGIKDELINQLKRKIKNKGECDFTKDTESIVLILDVACCPYFSVSQKQELLSKMNLTNTQINNLIEFGKQNKYFFTKWTGVDVTKELAAKISQEVYS